MPTSDEQRRQILGEIAAHSPLAAAKEPAAAAIQQWDHLAEKFNPLLGPDGVRLIYARSLELNKATFQWLPLPLPPNSSRTLFAPLQARFESRPAVEVVAAQAALFRTFTDLLAALIGERLTTQFLRSAFAADDTHDNSQEAQNDGQN